MTNAANMSNTVDIGKKNSSGLRINQITVHHIRGSPKVQHDILNQFKPSPELIVDFSQSSESTEKLVLNNHYLPVSF